MKVSDPVNLADVRFDEATPDQFEKYWRAQGWAVDEASVVNYGATRRLSSGHWLDVRFLTGHAGYLVISLRSNWIRLNDSIATFGEALHLANNLAQAELFGGWAE
jgi:hypothetical protein